MMPDGQSKVLRTSGLSYGNGQFDLHNARDQQDREEKT